MKKVFGILAVAALLVLPVAAYAAPAGHVGNDVIEEKPTVILTETGTEVISKIKENTAITGGKEVVSIDVSLLPTTPEIVSVDKTKLVVSGRTVEAVVAPLPELTASIPAGESAVNVILTVPTENFKDIAVNNILFFLEHRTAGQNAIHVPYRERIESDDDDESYVFVNDEGDEFGPAASEETPNLVIRNLKYEGDYNLSRSTTNTSSTPQAVSFANGRSITFKSEFVEAAARSYSDGGGCDAGLAPLALAALAGIAFVFKKD